MKITIAMLREWRACDKAIRWARRKYPNGIPLSAARIVRKEWLRWIVQLVPNAKWRSKAWAAIIAREDVTREDYCFVVCYAPNIWRAKALVALFIRKDVRPEDYRWIACHAPNKWRKKAKKKWRNYKKTTARNNPFRRQVDRTQVFPRTTIPRCAQ